MSVIAADEQKQRDSSTQSINKSRYLKLKTIHKYVLYPYKKQISILRLIALRGVWAHFQRRKHVIYHDRNRVVEFLLQLENKQI